MEREFLNFSRCLNPVFLDVSNYLDASILESLTFFPLLNSFPRPKSFWSQDFVKRIMRIRILNTRFLFFKTRNEKPWSDDEVDHFERDFSLDHLLSP